MIRTYCLRVCIHAIFNPLGNWLMHLLTLPPTRSNALFRSTTATLEPFVLLPYLISWTSVQWAAFQIATFSLYILQNFDVTRTVIMVAYCVMFCKFFSPGILRHILWKVRFFFSFSTFFYGTWSYYLFLRISVSLLDVSWENL